MLPYTHMHEAEHSQHTCMKPNTFGIPADPSAHTADDADAGKHASYAACGLV